MGGLGFNRNGVIYFRYRMDRIANTGIKAIIQPGRSMRDQEVMDASKDHGNAMILTGARCFKH